MLSNVHSSLLKIPLECSSPSGHVIDNNIASPRNLKSMKGTPEIDSNDCKIVQSSKDDSCLRELQNKSSPVHVFSNFITVQVFSSSVIGHYLPKVSNQI